MQERNTRSPTTSKIKKIANEPVKTDEVLKSTSMDDDAGRAIIGTNMWEGFEDIPVGIRAFMKTEKAIKSRRMARDQVKG